MQFCDTCDNMYYIKLEGEDCNKVIYYCRNCGNTSGDFINTSKCILKENIIKNDTKYNIKINKYTKLDNTLPRINYIKCPNIECNSNSQDFDIANREILYIRYDNTNMKYMYLCSHCDFTWNTEK